MSKDAFSKKFQEDIYPFEKSVILPDGSSALAPNIERAAHLGSVAHTPGETAYANRHLAEMCNEVADSVVAAILRKI